ncbi:MAG TPA: molybdate ABC transporter permease subunit [Polyangiaceae bacterium]|nr:molybdate ABC transporter permease subunit [Polyangiaceae bacterium]
MLSHADALAVALTVELAGLTTGLLLAIGTPIAWWLSNARTRWRAPVAALLSLPLVLPPTVLGFYLLILLGPHGPLGAATQALGLGVLPFTFGGLVVGSTLYSLPYVLQPLKNTFDGIGRTPFELAATLGAGPAARFFTVALPLARPGIVVAAVLGFAHTVGEFGVVLMIGGNIPGKTRVVSVALYDHVEALEYADAHRLAGGLLVFSFLVLLAIHSSRAAPKPI